MFKFISFGSGSSGNCYYLATATDALIIDIGVGIRTLKKQCRDYGVDLNKVNHVLITHDHTDHIKSVGSFSHDYKVPVYATKLVHMGIESNYCITRKVAPDLKVTIVPGLQLNLGDFVIKPFAVPHDSSENVGYEVRVGDVCFVIITDAGSITEECYEAIANANYLVIEANHDCALPARAAICRMKTVAKHLQSTCRNICATSGSVISARRTIILSWLARRWRPSCAAMG